MLNLSRKIKSDKGSITSFTLLSMLFFLVVVIAIYASVNTKVQKQQKELNTIQKSYEQQEQLNDIYEKKYDDYINSETSTIQVYADTTLKGEVKGQKKNTLGTVYTNAVQNKIKIFGGANSTYAYSETADGKRNVLSGNEITIQATTSGKTIYTWLKGEDGEYTKYYTAVTVKLSTLQDKTIYVAEGKTTDIGEISGQNKGKITYSQIDANYVSIENDKVTGIKAGDTTIIATESNGGAQAKITIKIVKLTLEKTKGITTVGDNKKIQVSGTNNGTISAKSNDETIAKVTVSGTEVTVIPQKVGNAKIIITESNAGANIEYEIQVVGITLAPNGGKYTMPTTGKATIKTKVKVENASKIEVAWTSSKLEWKTIENNSETIKKDCEKGTCYLYVRVDNEYLYQSQAFIVGEEKIAINIKTSTTKWTNQDITATITYPDVTTSNTRKAGYGTTLANAQTSASSATAPTTSVTVTANGYLYATATDLAGNVITASKQITNIDKEAPTITSVTTGTNTTYSDTATIVAKDASKIVAYGISKNASTQPTDWISTNKIDLTNVPTKVENGATWARVFYHNCVNGSELFTSEAEALSTNSRYKFSVLSDLENYRNSNGEFEFLLQYPNDTNQYNRWIQKDNPAKVTVANGTGNETAAGYKAVHVDWTGNYWGGLTKSTSTATFINGSVGHGNWFYAIGAYRKHVLGIPTYDSTASVAELWSRIDNLEKQGKQTINATIGNITENGTYYAWTKDIVGNVSSKEFTVNKVDKTAPTITKLEADNTNWTNKSVNLTVTANDAESGLYTASPYGWNTNQEWKNSATTTVTENGTYTVYVRNAIGNVSSKAITISNIDKTAPTTPVITAKTGSDTGSTYTSGTWTNQPVIITATSTDEQSQINRIEYSYDNKTWKTNWGTDLVTNGNQKSIKGTWNSNYNTTIYVRAVDNVGNVSAVSSIVLRQDKTAPTVTLSPNGGSYAKPPSENATIKTTITAADAEGSGLKTLQYAWSTSNTTEPTTWTTFTNGATVSKTDCTEGTYYLWTNVYDSATNRATTVKVSGGFVVGAKTITITPSTTTWTNQNITATITYPDVTTSSTRKAGYGTTLANAQTAATKATAPTTSVTVTANGYVYATATDSAGNVITASRQITNIDKQGPAITSVTTGTNTTYTDTATITANDASKIVAYGISKNVSTQPTDWISTNKINLTNVPKKVENGATWARVFYHNCVNGSELFTSEAEALSTNSRYKFSVLSDLENYRNSNGEFEFLLQYPNDTNQYNRWIQKDNPAKVTVANGTGNETAAGYKAVHVDWTGNYWGGLTKSTSTATFINGSVGHGNWFYAIGAYRKHVLGIPTYDSTASVAELWSRIDNLEKQGKQTINATIGNITENGTYYAWTKDIVGNVSSKEFTVNKVDKTAPTITKLEADNTNWTNKSVNLTVTANDAESGLYTASPYGWNTNQEWKNSATTTVTENGTYTVYVRNAIGNVSSKAITISNIDKTAPTTPVITAKTGSDTGSTYTSGTWTNQPVIITATSTDEQSQINRIEYSYDNKTWKTNWGTDLVTNGNQKSIKGTWNSNYNTTVYVRAVDNVENVSAVSSIVLRQDKTAPTMTTPTISPTGWTKGNVTVTAKAIDNASGIVAYQWSTNSGLTSASGGWTSITNTKSQITQTYTATGNGTYYFYAKDASGNLGVTNIKITNIDKTPPTINSNLKATGTTINSISLSLGVGSDTGSGLKKIEWYYGTTNNPTTKAGETSITTAQTATYTVSNLGLVTTYYLKAIVYDAVGNQVSSAVISAKTANPKAEDVSYAPADSSWNVENVKQALDYFFNK